MAENYHHNGSPLLVCASIGAIVLGAPLLGMMGLSLLASITLLVVCSPLFLLFSPLLLGAFLVLVATLAGFAVAISMGIVGGSALLWVAREARVRLIVGVGVRKVGGDSSKQRMKGKELDYYLGDPFATTSKA